MRRAFTLGALGLLMLLAGSVPAGAQVLRPEQTGQGGADNPYTPPPCTGIFNDVPCPGGFAVGWIEQLAADGITAGCGGGNYCPGTSVTRDQMAVFIEKAMHGTATWSPGDLGNYDTGLGSGSLLFVAAGGSYDTGVGTYSLYADSTGSNNTAVGAESLYSNETGNDNTAIGQASLVVATGSENTGVGFKSMYNTSTGNNNTALGSGSLWSNTSGNLNTAVGYLANVQSGDLVNATAIGNDAVADASNHVRIGNTAVTQIGGEVGWSALSDLRAKTDIQDLDLGLDFIMVLRPVSFKMKQGDGRTAMGFIAQDVEALLGDDYSVLGIGGDEDRTLSLRYGDFVAPVVKAIQEQEGQIEQQRATIAAQQAKIDAQQGELDALEARLAALEARLPQPTH